MKFSALFNVVTLSSIAFTICFERPNECLPGPKHKEAPSAERSLQACLAYQDNACCTANFTQQLGSSPVEGVGNFSWSPCSGTLSPKCEAFMVKVECFYRCSHNAIFWKNRHYPSAILKMPICASECDAWLEACKDDLTCARNWITDYNMSSNGANTCKQPCEKYTDVYSSGEDLCENLWGASFVSKEIDCLKFTVTDSSDNDKVVEKLFGRNEAETSAAPTATEVSTVPSGAYDFNFHCFSFLSLLCSIVSWFYLRTIR